jgi:hypothetical protein
MYAFVDKRDALASMCPPCGKRAVLKVRAWLFAPERFSQRRREWVGHPQTRAFIPPPLFRATVRKVWIYRDQTRLRRRR